MTQIHAARLLAAGLLAVTLASAAGAQEEDAGLTRVTLRSGKTIEGQVVAETFDEMKLRLPSGDVLTIPADDIAEIVYPEKPQLEIEEATEADVQAALERMRNVAATPRPGGAFVQSELGEGASDILYRGMVSIRDGVVTVESGGRARAFPIEEVTEVIGEHSSCITTAAGLRMAHRAPPLERLFEQRAQELISAARAEHEARVERELAALSGTDPPSLVPRKTPGPWRITMDLAAGGKAKAEDIAAFLTNATAEICDTFRCLAQPEGEIRVRVFSSLRDLQSWKKRFHGIDLSFEIDIEGVDLAADVLRSWYLSEQSISTLDLADQSALVLEDVERARAKLEELLQLCHRQRHGEHFAELTDLFLLWADAISLAAAQRDGTELRRLSSTLEELDVGELAWELAEADSRKRAAQEATGGTAARRPAMPDLAGLLGGPRPIELGPRFEVVNPGYFNRSTRELVVLADDDLWMNLAHEVFHYVSSENGLELPMCLEEGLACYFETLSAESHGKKLGGPNVDRIRERKHLLAGGEREIPLAALLRASPEEFRSGGKRALLHYDESWLLVHTLLAVFDHGGRRRGRRALNGMMSSLNDGAPWEEVIAQCFVRTLARETVEERMREYVRDAESELDDE